MIIKNIQVKSNKTHTTLSADVAFFGHKTQNMYLRVRNEYKDFVAVQSAADTFFAALLLPAMRKGEDLVVEGPVSSRLLKNAEKIMSLVEGWEAGFKRIRAEGQKPPLTPPYQGENSKGPLPDKGGLGRVSVGCFFTGGVDSFYTFLKHRKDISHFILIHGCDIPLENKEFFAEALKSVKKIAQEVGINVIVVETNMRTIIEQHLEWEWELGGALSAVAHFLGDGLQKVFVPSGLRYDQLAPYGTHPDLDPLFSTEKVQFVHDGCEYSRLEKVIHVISKSSLALKYLRVCCQIIKGKYNCNECVKCEQTKMELLCAGALEKAKTLTNTIDLALVRNAIYNTKLHYHYFAEDILHELKKQQREPALQEAVAVSIQKSKHLPFLRRLANTIAFIDKTYLDRRIYSFIFGFTEAQDRTIFYKFLSRVRLIS